MSPPPLGMKIVDSCMANNRRSRHRVIIFLFTFLIYTCYHMSRKPISVVKSALHDNCTAVAESSGEIVVPSNETYCDFPPFDGNNWSQLLGSLDLAYLFAYAGSMFFCGQIAERINMRLFLTVGMLLCGATTAAFGAGYYFNIHMLWYYLIVQMFGGMVQATGWPSVVSVLGNWFGKRRRGFLMGLWNSHTSVGNILGSVVAGAFVSSAWGLSFIVPGIIIGCMGIVVFFFLVPYPEDVNCEPPEYGHLINTLHSAVAVNESSESSAVVTDGDEEYTTEHSYLIQRQTSSREETAAISIGGALRIPGVIEYSLCLFFAKLVSYTFLYWLPTYIKLVGQYETTDSALLSTVFDLGGILGGMSAGFVADLTGASALTCSTMFLISVPLLFVYNRFGAEYVATNIVFLIILGLIVNGPYALITTAVAADLGTHRSLAGNARALATVTSIIDGTGSIGAAIGPLLCGLIVPYGWNNVFYMLIAATVLAAILLIRRDVKEIHTLYNQATSKRLCNGDGSVQDVTNSEYSSSSYRS